MATPLRREQAPPTDPDVQVPRAVREASERASAAQTQAYGTNEPPPADPSFPPAAPQAAGATPVPPPAPSPASAPEPSSDQEQTWEQRYNSLRGRRDSELKRSRETIDQLTQRLAQLEERQKPPPQPKPLQLTPDEINDYGEDFIGMVQRIAQHTVEGKIAPLAQEVGRTQRQVGVHQNQGMHAQMTALYPDWEKMNEYEPFVQWTQLPDPYSGVIRGTLMQEAWNAGDARRVNAFFQGFLAEEAALNPAGAGRQAATPLAPPNGAPAPAPPLTLTRLAAPGGARSAQSQPAEKRVYTPEDITRFYTEVAAGKWRHRDQERAAVDLDIHQAQHEGRIIQHQGRFAPPQPPRGFTV